MRISDNPDFKPLDDLEHRDYEWQKDIKTRCCGVVFIMTRRNGLIFPGRKEVEE